MADNIVRATGLTPLLEWIARRGEKAFYLNEAVEELGSERGKTLRALERLRRSEILEMLSDERIPAWKIGPGVTGPPRRNPQYRAVRDVSALRPGRPRKRSCRDAMWRTMRAKRRFTIPELAILCNCTEDNCRQYVKHLMDAGIVIQRGMQGRAKLYFLKRDSGPIRPATPGADCKKEAQDE